MVFWVIRYLVWSAPDTEFSTNQGIASSVATELGISFVVGLVLTRYIRKNKQDYGSALLYWPSQILSVGLFVFPALLFISVLAGMVFLVVQ